MQNYFIIIFFFIFHTCNQLNAQAFERLTVPFTENGSPLENALAGGLNSPQLSAVDLNKDGLDDLFVFDRVGNQSLCFLNKGGQGESHYVWAPEYESRFPRLRNWVLLRDFNRDGAMDIFSYSDVDGIDGVIVYRGYYEEDGLHFSRMTFSNRFNLLPYNFDASNEVYITGIDYPAVDDVDCDGDLDLLTFNAIAPGRLEWYKNEALERGKGLDTIILRLKERCWGGFFESGISPEVDLAPAPGDCVNNFQTEDPLVRIRHAGSTVLSLDIDADDDKDLIIGDLSFSHINRLLNGGSCEEAWINEQDPNFPTYDTPAAMRFFPAAFHLDLNNDGKKDLAVAPNADRESENKENLWWYENIGMDEAPDFTLRRKDFLVQTMLDLGGRTHPAVVDYNGDGLKDLVIGSEGFFAGAGKRLASLHLYENTGTAKEPAFKLVDTDFASLQQFTNNTFNFAPTFGDLDADGDLDLIVGEELGQLFYAENTAETGEPMKFSPPQYGYQGIDVGFNSTPFLFDFNEDGLLDLLIGEENGNINYFQNKGTPQIPDFESDPALEPNNFFLGQIDARIPGFLGYSSPWVGYINGEQRVLTGTEIGRLEAYQLAEVTEAFPLLSENWGEVSIGASTHPFLADIDSDGLHEVLVGNARGGLSIFQSDWFADNTVPVQKEAERGRLRVFPNPAHHRFLIELPLVGQIQATLHLYNQDGQLVLQKALSDHQIEIGVAQFPAGIYFLRVQSGNRVWNQKLVLMP